MRTEPSVRPGFHPSPKASAALDAVAIAVLTLVLNLTGFRFPYLFDDFDFIERTLHFSPQVLLPDPREIFYRPLSREIYFGALQSFGAQGAFVGHLLNLLALAASGILVYLVARRVLHRRAGILAGTAFAALGANGVLVAWVCGSQDALAIVLIVASLYCELEHRHLLAVALAGLALLAKETVVALIPAIALCHYILNTTELRNWRHALDYGILVTFWAAIHPGIHLLAHRGFAGDRLSYVGFGSSLTWNSLVKPLISVLNFPSDPHSVLWWRPLSSILIPAIAAAAYLGYRASSARDADQIPTPNARRVLLLGLALGIPPLVLSSLIIRNWLPYYACIPAVGVSVTLGALAARAPKRTLPLLAVLYVSSGLCARSVRISPGLPSEPNLAPAAGALHIIEPQVRELVPSVAPNTQFLVFVMTHGPVSVHSHVYNYQVFRSWYRDTTIIATRPELRRGDGRPEVLLWITPEMRVYKVDPVTLLPQSVTIQAKYSEYQRVMRSYARGLAASGQLDRALTILLSMPERDPTTRGVDRRIAAALLIAAGRRADAESLLVTAPWISPSESVELVSALLMAPTAGPADDTPLFEAFQVPVGDAETLRGMMMHLDEDGYPAAVRLARRLVALHPGDPDALRILATAQNYRSPDAITPRGL